MALESLLTLLALGLLAAIDDSADQHDLIAWVVLDGEGEGAVGLDLSFGTLAVLLAVLLTVFLTVSVFLAIFFLIVLLVLMLVLLLVLFLGLFDLILLGTSVGRADALFVDLDGSLVDQFVQVQVLLLLLLLLLLAANAGEVGLVAIESVLDALLHQGLLGIHFVGDLNLGQLHSRVLLLLVAIVQQLLQLLTVLDLLLFNLGQAVLLLRHDDVHGQFLLLSGNADHLDLVVLVVIETALALDSLALLRLLASQRIETCWLSGLLLTELTSPLGLHLQGADCNHFRVVGDGLLWHDVLHLLARLGRHQLIDLLTALLWASLEGALLDLSTQAFLDSLHELALSASLLVDNDTRSEVDFGFLLAVGLLSRALSFLNVVGSLQDADQGSVSLLALLLAQTWALGPLNLSLGVASGSLLQSSQSDLNGSRRDDRVLVIAFGLCLLVQLGSQVAVGLLQLLQELVVGLALLLSLWSVFLWAIATGSLAFGSQIGRAHV